MRRLTSLLLILSALTLSACADSADLTGPSPAQAPNAQLLNGQEPSSNNGATRLLLSGQEPSSNNGTTRVNRRGQEPSSNN